MAERGVSRQQEAAETAAYFQALSDQTGVPVSEITAAEVRKLLSIFTAKRPPQKPDPLITKYLQQIAFEPGKLATSRYLLDAIVGTDVGAVSYGSAMRFYQLALQRYQQQFPDPNHRALLAGATCAVSMIEFGHTVTATFPEAQCLTIDLQPTDKPQHTTRQNVYHTLDATNLQLNTEVNTIHTSGLLDYLDKTTEPGEETPYSTHFRRLFFTGAHRALVTGGMLIMVERPIQRNRSDRNQPFISELQESGFSSVEVSKVPVFRNRRLLDRFMSSGEGTIDPKFLKTSDKLMGIIATA